MTHPETTGEDGKRGIPAWWHDAVRALPGMKRPDADVFVSNEEYFPRWHDFQVCLYSIREPDGYGDLESGLYLLTNARLQITGGDPRTGAVLGYITKVFLTHRNKALTTGQIPKHLRDAHDLPANIQIDYDAAYEVHDLEGTLAGLPIYQLRPPNIDQIVQRLSGATAETAHVHYPNE